MINYDDFKKIELKTAKILSAEKIEGSEKLIKLEIDLGQEKRQLVAGIAKTYTPETLVGKTIIVAINLEPKSLMGLESQGMLLAAHGQEGPVLLTVDSETPAGSDIN